MTQKNYGRIDSLDQLKALVDRMGQTNDPIGFDIETGYDGPIKTNASLWPHLPYQFIVGFSFTVDPAWARYVPVRHDFANNLDEDKVWEIMKPLLEMPDRIIAHNEKFERRNCRANVDIELGIKSCSMLEQYVLSDYESFGIKHIVEKKYGHKMTELTELFPVAKGKKRDIRFNRLEISPGVVAYACEDAAWALQLHIDSIDRVLAERKPVYDLEMQISELMADVEDYGVSVDWVLMEKAHQEGEAFYPRLESEIKSELGAMSGKNLSTANLRSPKQLQELLYGELGMTTTRTTASGAMSTDTVALNKLANENPPLRKLLRWREVQNHINRLKKWGAEFGDAHDKKVHANYKQAAVGTGRFAANDPAIQQCPKEWRYCLGVLGSEDLFDEDPATKEPITWKKVLETTKPHERFNYNFRDFLIASPGKYLLGFDYSQIELRVMAGLSGEQLLLDAFNKDEDVHVLTAAMMLGKRPEDITDYDRAIGKTMNFALLYGMGPQSLAERLGITRERANELFAQYFSGFASITSWQEQMKREGKQRGYTLSWIGRKYTIFELQSDNRAIYAKGERVLVNAPVQGGAADYMKIAMVRSRNALREKNWWMADAGVAMIMNQHDALIFEVDESIPPEEVINILRPAVEFKVPDFPKIVSDWEIGYRWGSMQKVKGEASFVQDNGKWLVEKKDNVTVTIPLDATAPVALEEPYGIDVQEAQAAVENGATDDVPATGKKLIVELQDMPDTTSFNRFVDLVSANLGANTVYLRTPEGELPIDRYGTSLTPADQSKVSMTLPGARVFFAAEDVDASALSGNLTL